MRSEREAHFTFAARIPVKSAHRINAPATSYRRSCAIAGWRIKRRKVIYFGEVSGLREPRWQVQQVTASVWRKSAELIAATS
jgi:hypothetical protein